VNAILSLSPKDPDLELQIKDQKAYQETVIDTTKRHHVAYKYRHIALWRGMTPAQELTMVEGGRQLRRRYLEMTYGFGRLPINRTQKGVIYQQ